MDYQWYGFRVSQHNLCPLLRLPKMGWSKLWCLDTYHKGRMVGWFHANGMMTNNPPLKKRDAMADYRLLNKRTTVIQTG
jgi:hypothetical protein